MRYSKYKGGDILDDKNNVTDNIQWHPAFYQAMWIELSEYASKLEFLQEYQLTTEPLLIDMLIIKKPPDVKIEKNIGRIFRGHNIIEYKSPEDNFTFNAYNKVFAYLYLYSSLNKVDISDTTLTCAVSNHPRNLLKRLRDDSALTVEERGKGIYYITGERVPVQIIETKSLSEDENLWLKSLRSNLDERTFKHIIYSSEQYDSKAAAYAYAIFQANKELMEGVEDMTLEDIMLAKPGYLERLAKRGFGDITQIRREAEDEIKRTKNELAKKDMEARKAKDELARKEKKSKEKEKEVIKSMLKSGTPYETIADWMTVPVEKVAEIDKLLHAN